MSTHDKPLIGVSTSRKGWRMHLAWWMHALCIALAGGRALRLVPGEPPERAQGVDGLVVGGGDDIGPTIYGGEIVLGAREDPERDRMEIDLVSRARRERVPVLGICRGCQMLNVALGGTLHQEVREAFINGDHRANILAFKRVYLEEGSKLRELLRAGRIKVNALHHQAVDQLGKGLKATVRDGHGVIQGVEDTHDPEGLMIGVQWHPEFLFYSGRQMGLYRALVDAARTGMMRRAEAA